MIDLSTPTSSPMRANTALPSDCIRWYYVLLANMDQDHLWYSILWSIDHHQLHVTANFDGNHDQSHHLSDIL
jgi:hypothetical protein